MTPSQQLVRGRTKKKSIILTLGSVLFPLPPIPRAWKWEDRRQVLECIPEKAVGLILEKQGVLGGWDWRAVLNIVSSGTQLCMVTEMIRATTGHTSRPSAVFK